MVETAKPTDGPAAKDDNQFTQNELFAFIARHKTIDGKIKALKKTQNMLRREVKNNGILLHVFDEMRKAFETPNDSELEETNRQRIRIAKFLGMPIGTQMGFFDSIPDEAATPSMVQRAHEQGIVAGNTAVNLDDCPHDADTDVWQEWTKGWHEGQAALAKQLAATSASI